MLNSNCDEIGGCARSSPQGRWLAADLVANPRECTLAVWHHPRFSAGSKHGGGANRSPLRRLLPEGAATSDLYAIFHEHGGDLILSGHENNYSASHRRTRWATPMRTRRGNSSSARAARLRARWARSSRTRRRARATCTACSRSPYTLRPTTGSSSPRQASATPTRGARPARCGVSRRATDPTRAEASTLCDAVLDAVGVELTAALALAVLLNRFRRSRIRATA